VEERKAVSLGEGQFLLDKRKRQTVRERAEEEHQKGDLSGLRLKNFVFPLASLHESLWIRAERKGPGKGNAVGFLGGRALSKEVYPHQERETTSFSISKRTTSVQGERESAEISGCEGRPYRTPQKKKKKPPEQSALVRQRSYEGGRPLLKGCEKKNT